MSKFMSLCYSNNFASHEEAVEEARRLRRAFAGQHVKLIIRDELNEDYVLVDGIAHWYLLTEYFVEILVHKESRQIPF